MVLKKPTQWLLLGGILLAILMAIVWDYERLRGEFSVGGSDGVHKYKLINYMHGDLFLCDEKENKLVFVNDYYEDLNVIEARFVTPNHLQVITKSKMRINFYLDTRLGNYDSIYNAK